MKNKINMHSIKAKMICYISAIVLVVSAGLGFSSYMLISSTIHASTNESLDKIAQQASNAVSARISDKISTIHALSSNDLFKDMKNNIATIDESFTARAKMIGYTDIFMADKDGNATISGKPYNIADRDYFKKAISGTDNMSDPVVSKTDKSLQICIAVPIKVNDETVGVLVATMDGNFLSNSIADVTYGKTGNAFMINGKGTIIAHSDKNLVLTQDNAMQNAKADSSFADLAALEVKMTAGQNGVGQYTYKGVTKYMGYHQIPGTDWSIGLAAPESEVFSSVSVLGMTLLLLAFLFLALSIFAAYMIARTISDPIKAASTYADGFLAKGDFTKELGEKFLNRRDEVGILAQAFQDTKDNLNKALSNINAASEQVAAGSKQVSDSSTALSQGATEQASSIEQLTASIEEIAAQTKHNAESAKEANTLAESTKDHADMGSVSMKEMLHAMDDIEDSSANIAKIIKTIDDIAFQTNILALNAAVEAARAGQYGKGFAVVAEEVRNLAAKSAAASKETTVMIENSIKKVGAGTKIAQETSEALNSIVHEVDKVSRLVNEIAVASNEQSSGIAQINQGIMQVSSVVQANSATSEETASSSEELSGQAELLKDEVAKFKLAKEDSHVPSYKGIDHTNLIAFNTIDNALVGQGIGTEGHSVSMKKISLSDNDFGKY